MKTQVFVRQIYKEKMKVIWRVDTILRKRNILKGIHVFLWR